ncbi:MAG: hypothetical protein QOG06_880 [Gaiellaceae bacterium]|jgi:hypothetical protein|nr:hypothetical protein [Gaiellaceae bacterium]
MSGGRRLVLSGVGLTALLALVAVASHAHRPGGGSGSGGSSDAPRLVFVYFASLMFVLFPIGALIVLWVFSMRRRQRLLEGGATRRQLLSLLGLVLLGLPVALGVRYYSSRNHSGPPAAGLQKLKQGKGPPLHAGHTATAQFQWLPALVLASLLLAVLLGLVAAFVWKRHSGADWESEAALTAALDEVLADTLDDLRAEKDPRRAVIGAFRRLEKTFAAHRVPRDQAETPREYVDRALERLGVSVSAVRRLIGLYERAKFSRHTIDASMKDDAIEALVSLRAELEAETAKAAA